MTQKKRTGSSGYRHTNVTHENKIRVRGKRLDQVDTTKLTLAYWLLAKQLTEDKTDGRVLNEPEVRRVMERLETEEPKAALKPSKGKPASVAKSKLKKQQQKPPVEKDARQCD